MITPSGNSLNLTYCKDRRQALRQEQPDRLTELAQFTEQETRLVNERLERLGTAQTETNQRLNRMDGHPGNLEGNDYERKVRCRVMAQSPARFELNNPYRALTQDAPATRPQSPLTRVAGSIAKAVYAHPRDPGTTATRR